MSHADSTAKQFSMPEKAEGSRFPPHSGPWNDSGFHRESIPWPLAV